MFKSLNTRIKDFTTKSQMESEKSEWTQVKSRRDRRSKVYPINKYWSGFEENGREKWYIEMNDGSLLTSKHEDFDKLSQKYYPHI